MKFEWDPQHTPTVKLALHATQVVLGFASWCIGIAVFRGKDAKVVGNNAWTFAVFLISIPAWIYLIMTPRFSRARRFAEPHAMLAVDGVFTVLWLSAFATQAAYNSSGKCGEACGLSKAVVGLGVFVTLFFGATTLISAYTMTFYNFHGSLPGYDSRKLRTGDDNSIDPDKAAFSMAPHDDEAYERINADDHEGQASSYGAGGYGNANPYSADDDDPNRYGSLPPRSSTLFDSETAYNSGAGGAPPASGAYSSQTAGPLYEDGPAQFPAGDYDRGHR